MSDQLDMFADPTVATEYGVQFPATEDCSASIAGPFYTLDGAIRAEDFNRRKFGTPGELVSRRVTPWEPI
ncbi:hypothetical protein [Gordonia sp. OPL2]|uniref:hypothetical protein n=1 Tax=Gordonia sp. OPL2 TaxID=2486274 RepID=UPI0016554F0F|nr:hypothetical protein [Gordonia sp. OPL2]ROZ88989.1 hypothetical protein EEB19_19965 [Gordonia sp. OPL2]